MVDVDSFTDAELRTKLIEYGFPIMPITGTTRKVMAKKLKLLMENKGKPSDRRSLAQFSSEEESDAEPKSQKKEKNRRATMAVIAPPQSPAPKLGLRKTGKQEYSSEVTKTIEKKTRTVEIAKNGDADTNSDSEPEIVETDYKYSSNLDYAKKASPAVRDTRSSPIVSSTGTTSSFGTDAISRNYFTSPSSTQYTSYKSPGADKLNQIRSRLSLGTTNYESPIYTAATLDTNTENATGTPFLSNFTQRLSQLSTKSDYDSKADVKEYDINGSGLYSRTYLTRPKLRDTSRNYQVDESRKSNNISYILVGSVALFFVILAALYWGMHSGSNSNEIIGLVVPYCTAKTGGRGENCILDSDVSGAVDLYKLIKPELIRRSISFRCDNNNQPPHMTEENIVAFIRDSTISNVEEFEILEDLQNFIILLYKNPVWGITVMQNTADTFEEGNEVYSLEQIVDNKKSNFKTSFVILDPTLPLGCNVYIKFIAILKVVLTILSVAAVLWGTKRFLKFYKHQQEQAKEEVILMVEKIIDILQCNSSSENDNFMVINHVRDMILPIQNRKKMEKVWNNAVKFIEENESRVRTEVQVVTGEQYEVWRWLGGLNTSSSCNKSWQGQAFETQVGSVNSPPCSPTTCLKIRGMVEEGDTNLHSIREAVLVKCAEQCHILHCVVDSNSKCVYLKCADKNDAAIAYRNLHGWWYASHLVTVKYLRLERYMQRFSDSPTTGPPFLKPCHATK